MANPVSGQYMVFVLLWKPFAACQFANDVILKGKTIEDIRASKKVMKSFTKRNYIGRVRKAVKRYALFLLGSSPYVFSFSEILDNSGMTSK